VEVRREKIRKALDKVTREVSGARWREDEALVDTVNHLTEWPDVLLGSFEADYLALPEEVLVTVMRDHQKYFAVEDSNGKLAPYFLTVTNIALDAENTATIRQGNERVLRARFNDARFFWEFDQRTPLVDRVKLLENVTFQKELGSYAKKSERVRSLSAKIAKVVSEAGASVDASGLDEAARLSKTDLTTELVKEFTELQGIIGGLYAKAQGISTVASEAIYDQYTPANMDDDVPRSTEGAILGIADRADSIAGMFSLGLEPTGSKDPFALRRAANGIVKILAETDLPLNIESIFMLLSMEEGITDKLRAFFRERVGFYLREVRGQAYDVVAAVIGPDSSLAYSLVRDSVLRAEAVTAARGGEDFLAVAAAFKRIKNILIQANYEPVEGGYVYRVKDAESALAEKALQVIRSLQELTGQRDYRAAIAAIAAIRPEIDAFFEQVMVMDPDMHVRQRRLQLLYTVLRNFSGIADFSEIVTAG
jgi:glycyl-tRNA synthetase beta chain